MDFRCFTGVVLVAGLLTSQAAAAGADNAYHLRPIVVTATRLPQSQDDVLASTTVITHKEIEHMQPQSVPDVLRRVPGVSITNQGGAGAVTSLFLRGTQSNHTVVLVDGVRYDDLTSGIAAIQDIPMRDIQRIEVVRGPFSSLYGSDALGGVIQIFTRDGTDADGAVEPHAMIGAGTYGTYEESAGLSGSTENAHYNLTVGHKRTDGFNACRGKPLPNGAGCYVDQPDKDGYERTSGLLRVGFDLGENTDVELHALRVESEVEFDGTSFVGNVSDNLRQVLGASVQTRLTDVWQTELAVGDELNKTENYYYGSFVNRIDSSITSLRWQNNLDFSADQHVVLGADYRDEQVDGTTEFMRTERDSTGVFAQYMGRFGANQLQLALRADNYETFDDPVTGSIRYGWHLDSVHTITASYGTAYSTPTFTDLYFPCCGNPNLEPEESESFELGFKASPEWGHWSVYAYQTEIDDLIAYDSDARKPLNISEARIRGVEASVGATFGAWDVRGSASWVDGENRSTGLMRGNQLARRPQYSAKLGVDRQFGAFGVGASLKYGGSRYEDAANMTKLDDFILVGLRGTWHVTDAFQVQARVDNLFDADYETIQYYNQPGRTVFVSLSYRP